MLKPVYSRCWSQSHSRCWSQSHSRCWSHSIADVEASLIADVEASLIVDVETSLIADVEASLIADVEANLIADVEASLIAGIWKRDLSNMTFAFYSLDIDVQFVKEKLLNFRVLWFKCRPIPKMSVSATFKWVPQSVDVTNKILNYWHNSTWTLSNFWVANGVFWF